MELVGSGSMEVGSVYTLTCTVSLSHRASDSSVSILWEGPSTHEQTVDTTDSRLVTRQLSLDPLSLADGGNYTCIASYTTGPKLKFPTRKQCRICVVHMGPKFPDGRSVGLV